MMNVRVDRLFIQNRVMEMGMGSVGFVQPGRTEGACSIILSDNSVSDINFILTADEDRELRSLLMRIEARIPSLFGVGNSDGPQGGE